MLDDVERERDAVFTDLFIENFKVMGSLFPTLGRHQIGGSLQLTLVGPGIVGQAGLVVGLCCLGMLSQSLQGGGTIEVQARLLLVEEGLFGIRQHLVLVEQFLQV